MECALCDLRNIEIMERTGGLAGCAARKAAHVFQARAGALGLGITTRKAAEGARAHFVACDSFWLLLFRRIQVFHDDFRTSVPQSSDQVRQARLF